MVAARAETGEVTVACREIDLVAQVQQALATVGADFATDLPPSLPAVGDPVRVRQVLRNLLTNAIRYGGPHRRVVARREGDTAVVEVRDDGQPLPIEQRRRIFEPYQRGHTTTGVTDSVGLGLAVARTLACLMQGDLEYQHDGFEAVFRLSLPVATPTTIEPIGAGRPGSVGEWTSLSIRSASGSATAG